MPLSTTEPASVSMSNGSHPRVEHPVEYSFVQCGPLRWRLASLGRGPVALFLHGAGASSHSMVALMRHLGTRYRAIAPDLPGHARTTSRDFVPSLQNVAGALAALLAQLDVEPELVVGHSAGAAVATRWALDGAGAGSSPTLLVGLAPALFPFRPGNALAQLAAGALGRSMWPNVLAGYLAKPRRIRRLLRSTGSILEPRAERAYQQLLGDPAHIRGVLAMMSQWDVTGLADEIEATPLPLLHITGAHDRAIDGHRIAQLGRRSHCSHVEVQGAGHLLHEEQPLRVSRIVIDQLAA